MGKHQKHAKLGLRNNNNFAPNEIAIVGTKCNEVSKLVQQVSEKLTNYKLAYFDASHSKDERKQNVEEFVFNANGNITINSIGNLNKFNQRIQFSQYDFVFINGNHYQATKQILVLDNEKEASVLKRLEQLNNIQFVIKLTEDAKYFDFLLEKNPQIKNLKCYKVSEIDKISKHIENLIQEKIAAIQGLVLAGGKSTRMGTDKGTLYFYGKNQRDVAIELLEKNHLKTYLSVRKEQDITIENKIVDTFIGLGPFGAICSAFQSNPNVAWLVLATDLPFVDDKVIQKLLKYRNPSKAATTIKGKGKQFPEPLITLWEPKSYPLLLNYLAQGYSCPRKVLINSEVEIIEVEDDLIRNINTPEEFKKAKKEINE
ncbi:NTP transferase domain-containing protein [Lutibacter sp.]|uniref:NTP transferase domain-containing protein n=1 Tax=Lutibacter sp. TaxID=1925666 RepID=UPI0025BEDEAD|nr:NTP transferase domain-containing protein [Lutibacter sp.]MCF6181907.1 NTP transferase domain-containing protein [Lutibacter sp.]